MWTAIKRLKTMAHTETKITVPSSPGSDETNDWRSNGPGGVEGDIGAPNHAGWLSRAVRRTSKTASQVKGL